MGYGGCATYAAGQSNGGFCSGDGALQQASDTLKADREFMLAVLPKSLRGWRLGDVSEALRSDAGFMLAVVESEPDALRYASQALTRPHRFAGASRQRYHAWECKGSTSRRSSPRTQE